MIDLACLLARRLHVLLDFDGPVCAVFGGSSDRAVADQLRADLLDLPAAVAASSDPFDVLRHARTRGPETLAAIGSQLAHLEGQAVETAVPTPGAAEAMAALRQTGHTITIVSNNSAAAVAAYLDSHGIRHLIDYISARTDPEPDRLKPHPYLLLSAMQTLRAEPGACLLIGDSDTDILAARAAGTAVIGYANKPGKVERFQGLRPDVVVEHMSDIAAAAGQSRPDATQ